MNTFKKFKQSLLRRPLARILAAVMVFAAIPGSLLIYAFNSADSEDRPFTESVTNTLATTPSVTYTGAELQQSLMLEGRLGGRRYRIGGHPSSRTLYHRLFRRGHCAADLAY